MVDYIAPCCRIRPTLIYLPTGTAVQAPGIAGRKPALAFLLPIVRSPLLRSAAPGLARRREGAPGLDYW